MRVRIMLVVWIVVCIQSWGQDASSIRQRITSLKANDSIRFHAPKSIDPGLDPIDSLTFHKLFTGSKLLGRWETKCCFYYSTIHKKVPDDKLNLLIVVREGHYRPYIVLTSLDENMRLIDEMVLAKQFIDAGEAVVVSSTLRKSIIEQITLDYNIGYEPFYKEIKSKFIIEETGRFKLIEKTEELKKL